MIRLQDLNFAYKRKAPLFNDLSLKVQEGGIYGLLGKNGAGKTSLLKIIAGLLFPQNGLCQVLDFAPKSRDPRLLSEIYFLPEQMYVPQVTAARYCNLYSAFYPKFNNKLMQQLMEEFELSPNQVLTQMSYGQKKKFFIAFGIATNCRLFILDEPTNGLDIPSKKQFRKILASHFAEDRVFIISTHQVHDVEKLIDSIIMLDDGKIIFNHSLAEVSEKLSFKALKHEPKLNECYYSEKQFSGYITVMDNETDEETGVDLEVLFNAILENKEKFKKLFAKPE